VGGLGQLPSIKKLRRTAVCKDELPEQGKERKKKKVSGEGSFKLPLMFSRDLETTGFTYPYLTGLGRYSTLFLNLSFSAVTICGSSFVQLSVNRLHGVKMDRKFSAFRPQDHASEPFPKPPESRPHLNVFFYNNLVIIILPSTLGSPWLFLSIRVSGIL